MIVNEDRLKRVKKLIGLLQEKEYTTRELSELMNLDRFCVADDIDELKAVCDLSITKIRNKNHYKINGEVNFELLTKTKQSYERDFNTKRMPKLKDMDRQSFRVLISQVIIQAVQDYKKPKLMNGSASNDHTAQLQNIKNRAEKWLKGEQCLNYCEELGYDRNLILRNLEIRGDISC